MPKCPSSSSLSLSLSKCHSITESISGTAMSPENNEKETHFVSPSNATFTRRASPLFLFRIPSAPNSPARGSLRGSRPHSPHLACYSRRPLNGGHGTPQLDSAAEGIRLHLPPSWSFSLRHGAAPTAQTGDDGDDNALRGSISSEEATLSLHPPASLAPPPTRAHLYSHPPPSSPSPRRVQPLTRTHIHAPSVCRDPSGTREGGIARS